MLLPLSIAFLAGCAHEQRADESEAGMHTKPLAHDTTTPLPKPASIQVRDIRGSLYVDIFAWDPLDKTYGLRSEVNRNNGELYHDHVIYVDVDYVPTRTPYPFAAIDATRLRTVVFAPDEYRCRYGTPCTPYRTFGARIPDAMLRSSRDSVDVRFFGPAGQTPFTLTLRRDFVDAYLKTFDSVTVALQKH